MSHTRVPHLKLPLKVGARGALETLEQDTVEEVAQCVEVLLSTERGERIELPSYGIEDPAFTVTIPLNEVQSQIEDWEPRAAVILNDEADEADELLRRLRVRVTGVPD